MSLLFSPYELGNLTLRNRATVAPMCQYSARHGVANDWHFVHLGRFAQGGFSLVTVEATAVTAEGRITYGDLGLWNDEQIAPLSRIVDFVKSQGAAAGIQLAHAGRKAATAVPWRGGFNETEAEKRALAFEDWPPVAPSALPHSPTHATPAALTITQMKAIEQAFVAAARRAEAAGFDLVEVHAAHGYLLNQFLSAVANQRDDEFGGRAENRRRFPLAVVKAVRAAWPKHKPLLVRLSAADALEGGVTLEDSIAFSRELKTLGVDMIHVSSGGFTGAVIKPAPGYQVNYAAAIKHEVGIPTMAVGLITEAKQAEKIIAQGDADLVALGREALDDPNWPLHAARSLGIDPAYKLWPDQMGYAVRGKDMALSR